MYPSICLLTGSATWLVTQCSVKTGSLSTGGLLEEFPWNTEYPHTTSNAQCLARWVRMMHHEQAWCISIMNTHDAWVLMMHYESSWFSMSTHDASWVPMMPMEAEKISTRPISQILRFPGFHFSFFFCFQIYFERIQEHPGSIQGPPRINLEAARVSRDHFVLDWLFKKFFKPWKSTSSVSRDRFWRNAEESMRNRCPVIFQQSTYSKNSRYTTSAAVMLRNNSCLFVVNGHNFAICNSRN